MKNNIMQVCRYHEEKILHTFFSLQIYFTKNPNKEERKDSSLVDLYST